MLRHFFHDERISKDETNYLGTYAAPSICEESSRDRTRRIASDQSCPGTGRTTSSPEGSSRVMNGRSWPPEVWSLSTSIVDSDIGLVITRQVSLHVCGVDSPPRSERWTTNTSPPTNIFGL